MSTKYLNIYDPHLDDGYEAYIYESESAARSAAGRKALGVAIPVEIPDLPLPYEWKVGDWSAFDGDTVRVADINKSCVAYHWRDGNGDPAADYVGIDVWIKGATPCDPPEWWQS